MKRARAPIPAIAAGLSPAIHAVAKARLEQDYAALVTGTATEDPRLLALRIAAAGDVLAHLAQLAAATATAPADEADSTDAVLAAARAGMADESPS